MYYILMAFDGSVAHALTKEFDRELSGGGISKIIQPERDELILTIKKEGVSKKLLLSASPSLPIAYITESSKTAPLEAPSFCMLLRKHLQGGRIISVTQPSMERIIEFNIGHYNEMGDIETLTLTIELMGKHSNIILRKGEIITDSIRHVSALVSSVREVLPGRKYFIPFGSEKLDPFTSEKEMFLDKVFEKGSLPASKALYSNITGLSPFLAEEIMYRAGLDSDRPASSFSDEEKQTIFDSFKELIDQIRSDPYPSITYKNGEPADICVIHSKLYSTPEFSFKEYVSVSGMLIDYYAQKQALTAIRQKTAGLRQLINSLLSRDLKKYDLQQRQLKDTEKKERFRVYGELLTAYGYDAEPGADHFDTIDFYSGDKVSILLDPSVSAIDNGKNYFKKYSKLKRTAEALEDIIKDTKNEIDYLGSVVNSIDMAEDLGDISQIRRELSENGYLKNSDSKDRKKGSGKNRAMHGESQSPLHFRSSDGFDIYVGKNNIQNDNITFKLASGNDWWFHAKDIPGSHVIVKSDGRELTDRTYEEAAALAAYYSRSEGQAKVEVQYTQRKNIKKPPASKPGFVVFNTYFSMSVPPAISVEPMQK